MLARKLLMASIGGGAFVIPSFTGSYSLFGDEQKGYIELYTSGTLTFDGDSIIDVFLLGGGNSGSSGVKGNASVRGYGGQGGSGSSGQNYYKIRVSGNYDIAIGSGGGNTSAFEHTQNAGGGANGGAGGTQGGSSTAGSTGIAIPFDGDSLEFTTTFGGGGGGGGYRGIGTSNEYGGTGGIIGGGKGGDANETVPWSGKAGKANTGGGGGGGGAAAGYQDKSGGAGGSGLVIVRWGY